MRYAHQAGPGVADGGPWRTAHECRIRVIGDRDVTSAEFLGIPRQRTQRKRPVVAKNARGAGSVRSL
jgi:hypothetical protein